MGIDGPCGIEKNRGTGGESWGRMGCVALDRKEGEWEKKEVNN